MCSAIDNFSFIDNMHHFVLVICNWGIARISHEISTFSFCFFGFHISLESSVSVLYFLFLKEFRWFAYLYLKSLWFHSKLYFHNSLSPMLYLPCAKRRFWDHYCLGWNWICLYSYTFLLELKFVGLSLSCYVCWVLISCLAYNCRWLSCFFVEGFGKHMVWWKVFFN